MYKLKTFDVGYREINEAGEEIPILLKCCSNFGAIPIIDNKTIGCEPKEAEKPEIAGPGS